MTAGLPAVTDAFPLPQKSRTGQRRIISAVLVSAYASMRHVRRLGVSHRILSSPPLSVDGGLYYIWCVCGGAAMMRSDGRLDGRPAREVKMLCGECFPETCRLASDPPVVCVGVVRSAEVLRGKVCCSPSGDG